MAVINTSPESSTPSSTNVVPSNANLAGLLVFHSTFSSSIQLVQPIPKLFTVNLDDENFPTWKQ